MRVLLLFSVVLLAFVPYTVYGTSTKQKQVAIVIDDFGNGMKGTEEILSLPLQLTIAVMPFLPTTERDATLATQERP